MVYHFKLGHEITDAEIRYQEDRLEFIEKLLGVRLSQKLEYYVADSRNEVGDLCFPGGDLVGDAMFRGDNFAIYSIGPGYNWHETVHAVVWELNHNANPSLNEGLAVFLQWGPVGSPVQFRTPVDETARMLARQSKLYGLQTLLGSFDNRYVENGSLVSFLLRTRTIEQFIKFLKLVPHAPSPELLDMICRAVYGLSADDLYYEWVKHLGLPELVGKDIPKSYVSNITGTFVVEDLSKLPADTWFRVEFFAAGTPHSQVQGIIDARSNPQAWSLTLYTQGDFNMVVWLDIDRDLRWDPGEPRGSATVSARDRRTVSVGTLTLK